MAQSLCLFQTNARFLSGHVNPTTAALVTPDDAADPSAGVEAAADIENHADDKVKVTILVSSPWFFREFHIKACLKFNIFVSQFNFVSTIIT